MISQFKVYMYASIAFISAVVIGYIKYLRTSNANKDTEINTLNNNIAVQEEVHKDDVKRTAFNSKQVQKVKKVNDESELEKFDKERSKDEVNPDFVSINI